jgi:hypothetical protein
VRLCVATPSRGWLHGEYTAGLLSLDTFDWLHLPGSNLPVQRDALTMGFLRSTATHMLCIDSDIGWRAEHVSALLETGKPAISATYCEKTATRDLPVRLVDGEEGPVVRAEFVPGGFLLLERSAIERVADSRRHLAYCAPDGSTAISLWEPGIHDGEYDSEDFAFCRFLRSAGVEVWLHREVVVTHYGEAAYRP